MLSKITGIPLEEVRDHLELLGDDGLVKLVPANGLQAMLSAKGRINLREGRMVATTSGVGVSTALALTHPVEITESLARFKAEHPDPAKAAFIMMRFGRTPSHEKIVQAICAALEPHGIAALRADDKQYHDELFSNIRTYMHGCATGIAVFERIETEDFNPNVSLEVGYMLALNKPVCLLKDKSLKTLHTDPGGLIYQPFDTHAPSKGIGKALDKWLSDKGLV